MSYHLVLKKNITNLFNDSRGDGDDWNHVQNVLKVEYIWKNIIRH